MSDWSGITIIDGTDQQSRSVPALEPGYFDVDELMFEELLAMGADYASAINFFNLKNEVHGTWAEMFSADEAVVMSMIVSTNLQRLESRFISVSYGRLEDFVRFMLDLACRIDFWFTRLDACQHKSGKALAQKIATIIEKKLAVELHNVGSIASRLDASPDGKIDSFGGIWHLAKKGSDQPFPKATVTDFGDPARLKQQLRSSFYAFFNAISYLKSITPSFLQESMSSQQHDPAIGLFMVFLKMYQRAQQKLNRFTQWHLDFYYEKILGTSDRGQLPESLYLLIEAQVRSGKTLVAKDTEFTAGKDASLNEIIYLAVDDLVVTPAKVKSLAMLHLQHDALISPESELGYVTRMKSRVPELSTVDSDEEQFLSWSLLGAEVHRPIKGNAADTRIGFALASPLLLLKEGKRTITLALELEHAGKVGIDGMIAALLTTESDQEFTRRFGGLIAQYLLSGKYCLSLQQKDSVISRANLLLSDRLAEEISLLLTQDWQGLFYKLFKGMFSIKLTTADGWLAADNYIIEPLQPESAETRAGLSILLRLDQEAEAISAYQAAVHGAGLHTGSPVLQCCINPQTHFYPYSLFQHFLISALHLSVDVKGVKNILAYNQHGQLDPSKPFQPFGPLPSSKSYFVFGNFELACKRLVDLKLNLEWGELPPNEGGFEHYYRGYETQYSNRIFKGEFCVLADGSWQPRDTEARPRVELFENEADSSRLSAGKVLSVDVMAYSKPYGPGIAEDAFDYSLKSRNGFFRLSLVSPPAAFGHAEYPALLTRVLTANARLKKNRATTQHTLHADIEQSVSRLSSTHHDRSCFKTGGRRYCS